VTEVGDDRRQRRAPLPGPEDPAADLRAALPRHLEPLKGDDALYLLHEIDRLGFRLGHRPEPSEVVDQARDPSSTLNRFFWPDATNEPLSPSARVTSNAGAPARKTPGPETESAEVFSRRFVDAARHAGNTKLDAIGAKMVPPVGGKYLSERIRDLGLDRARCSRRRFQAG
jgi:hypothetical protein